MIVIPGRPQAFQLAPNLHEPLRAQHAGNRIMFADMAGFFVGMALTLTLLVALCDLDAT